MTTGCWGAHTSSAQPHLWGAPLCAGVPLCALHTLRRRPCCLPILQMGTRGPEWLCDLSEGTRRANGGVRSESVSAHVFSLKTRCFLLRLGDERSLLTFGQGLGDFITGVPARLCGERHPLSPQMDCPLVAAAVWFLGVEAAPVDSWTPLLSGPLALSLFSVIKLAASPLAPPPALQG